MAYFVLFLVILVFGNEVLIDTSYNTCIGKFNYKYINDV